MPNFKLAWLTWSSMSAVERCIDISVWFEKITIRKVVFHELVGSSHTVALSSNAASPGKTAFDSKVAARLLSSEPA